MGVSRLRESPPPNTGGPTASWRGRLTAVRDTSLVVLSQPRPLCRLRPPPQAQLLWPCSPRATHPAGELSLVPLNPSLGCPHAQGGATACSALTPAAPWPPSVRPATCWVHRTPLPTSQGLFHHELHGTGFDSSKGPNSQSSVAAESWAWKRGAGHRPPAHQPTCRLPPRPASPAPRAPPDGAWTQTEDPWRWGWGLGEPHSLDPGQVPVEGLPRPRHPGQGSRSQDPGWVCKVVSGPLRFLERDGVLNLGERHSSEEPACRKQGQAQGI